MPTYKFRCKGNCEKEWTEKQSLLLNGKKHVSKCPLCQKEAESIPSGGTGTLMKGRNMNKYLEGFPDHTDAKNKEAVREGVELEKKHDAYVEESIRKDTKK